MFCLLFFVCFVFCFCWQLLICENTLIQVIKLKKKKNSCSRWESNPVRRRERSVINPLGHEDEVNFNSYFFLRDKLPISMKMLVFFLAKCVRNAIKTMVVDRKNQKAPALLYLASKPLRTEAVCRRSLNRTALAPL